jgi:class 3 adenylate cyclase
VNCPRCAYGNPAEARFCNQCGSPLEAESSQPGRRGPAEYTPPHLAERILKLRTSIEGERKQVTVLFADVKGSVALSRSVDAEEWHAILDRYFQILSAGIHHYEGTVNQYTGDGIMALFGAPFAHEDHAQRACHAALELRQHLASFAAQLFRERRLDFGVRMGIGCGEVVVGRIGDDLRMDYTAQGETVGLAARLQQLARPGHIAVSDGVARIVDGYFELAELGVHELAGIPEAVQVFDLVGRGALRTRLDLAAARGLSSLVGRDAALASLEAAFENAALRQGLCVGIEGEAGVGKSRICREFADRCRTRRAPVFEAHCPAHGSTLPGLAVRELLAGFFDLGAEGIVKRDADVDASRIEADPIFRMDDSGELLDAARAALHLPRDVSAAGRETTEHHLAALLMALIEDRSHDQPVLVCVDDLHWIDAESDAVLALLVDSVRSARCLLLVNFRPEYQAGWLESHALHRLGVRPLGPAECHALLDERMGQDPSLEGVRKQVILRSGGNPLFLEELVRSLCERGHLSGEHGDLRLARALETLELPATLQPILAARIDRLSPPDKHLLQIASVIGFEFERSILHQASELGEAELETGLRALQKAEFVHRTSLYPRAPFAFVHPLTREVAYGSLLSAPRRELHARVALAIEHQGERLGQKADRIAQHWDLAGREHEARRWKMRAGLRVTHIRPRRRHPAI